ncbi:MAG TPA: HAD family hydrolase [Solirubrobacteraceae bacterium]
MLPRVVACDLDGTLLRSDGTLDERSRRALAAVQGAGALLVLCTARPSRWMRPLAQATGHSGVAICANGAVVWDLHAEALLEARALPAAAARTVITLLRTALPNATWAVERPEGFAHESAYTPRWPVPEDTLIAPIDSLIDEPVVKLMLREEAHTADALLAIASGLVGHLAELSHSNSADCLVEIAAPGVNKASALADLCAARGIDPAAVIAFGDMPNDLPMLRWAGHGVAVSNAHPHVLAAADEITTGNDDAGVARVLERLLPTVTATD